MTDLADVSAGDIITSARQNLINDYIEQGTHTVNTLALNVNSTATLIANNATTGSMLSLIRDLDSTSTDSPIVLLKNDNATDNQYVLSLVNDAVSNCVVVDQNGEGQGINIDSEAANNHAIYCDVNNSQVLFYAGNPQAAYTCGLIRNVDSTVSTGSVMGIIQDNASDDQAALEVRGDGVGGAVAITYSPTAADNANGRAMSIYHGTGGEGGQAVFCADHGFQGITNFNSVIGGFYRNADSTVTAGPVVNIVQDNASDDQPAIVIQQDADVDVIKLTATDQGTGHTTIVKSIKVNLNNVTYYLNLHS